MLVLERFGPCYKFLQDFVDFGNSPKNLCLMLGLYNQAKAKGVMHQLERIENLGNGGSSSSAAKRQRPGAVTLADAMEQVAYKKKVSKNMALEMSCALVLACSKVITNQRVLQHILSFHVFMRDIAAEGRIDWAPKFRAELIAADGSVAASIEDSRGHWLRFVEGQISKTEMSPAYTKTATYLLEVLEAYFVRGGLQSQGMMGVAEANTVLANRTEGNASVAEAMIDMYENAAELDPDASIDSSDDDDDDDEADDDDDDVDAATAAAAGGFNPHTTIASRQKARRKVVLAAKLAKKKAKAKHSAAAVELCLALAEQREARQAHAFASPLADQFDFTKASNVCVSVYCKTQCAGARRFVGTIDERAVRMCAEHGRENQSNPQVRWSTWNSEAV